MGKSAKARNLFNCVAKDNEALAADIRSFVQGRQQSTPPHEDGHDNPDDSQLKVLLERLYTGICDFGQYKGSASTPDKKILAGWESFLDPIRALAEVKPHGHMMAARMVLYLTSAFIGNGQLSHRLPMKSSSSTPIALRCNFLIALDDALLSQLTRIWTHSNNREMFPWVFSEYVVRNCRITSPWQTFSHCHEYLKPGMSLEELHEQRRSERFKAACVTRPSELTPANGVHYRWRWTRPKGDTTTIFLRDPDCFRYEYQYHRNEDGPGLDLLMWQDIGSDGPIRKSYAYSLIDEDRREDHWRDRPALRRSRQFVLDARKIAQVNLTKDRRRLAGLALARSPLPLELEFEVLSYLEDIPEQHPYLSKLDLAAVYQPFPDIGKRCAECSSRGNKAADKLFKATCPHKSLRIWNLPLRMFHKFHLNSRGFWELCLLGDDCSGHHSDASWSGPSFGEALLEESFNKALQRRCGPGTTIKSIGLGPLDPVELPTEREDRDRVERMFSRQRNDDFEKDDIREEAHWTGISGLTDVMVHGRTLIGSHPSGSTVTDPQWMLGRTRQDERKAISGIVDTHADRLFGRRTP